MPEPSLILDRLSARAGNLYTLPAVAMEVLDLTANPQVDARELKTCIEHDPALTAKILRVVNSSLFGLARPVSDLNQALALLGIKPLKMLVLGFSLPSGLFAGVEADVLQRFWRHTLTKAVASRELSEALWNTAGDDAFVAALLQDLGELLLIRQVGGPYLKLLDRVHAEGRDLARTEAETMGFDHTELSARLLADWGLPQPLVEAVAWNHRLHQSLGEHPASPLKQTLHLAELLSRLLADGRPESLAEVLEAGRRYRDLSRQQLDDLVQAIEDKVRSLADVLSLDLPDGLDYRDVVARAHRRLAEVTEAVAIELARGQSGSAVSEDPTAGDAARRSELDHLAEALVAISVEPPAIRSCAPLPEAAAAQPTVGGATPGTSTPAASAVRTARTRTPAALADMAPGERLLHQISIASRACRQSRCPLSLVLVQFAGIDEMIFHAGVSGYQRLLDELEVCCRTIDHPCAIFVPNGGVGGAVILPDCDRNEAVRYGSDLARRTRQHVDAAGARHSESGVAIGVGAASVALPPRNFAAEDLYSAAARCLYASQACGGVTKSIEIY